MKQKKFHEDVKRSVAKAVTFRLIVLVSDAIVIFALTHRYDMTIGLVVLSNTASFVFYIAHEQIWNKVHWGKRSK